MALLLWLLPSTLAATLQVDVSGSGGAYTTIGAAVAAASDGDEIAIAAGTYPECVDPGGRNLQFVGAGSAVTTIDGAGACSFTLLVASGEEATAFTGLTILNTTYSNAYFTSGVVDLEDVVLTRGGSAGFADGNLYVQGADVEVYRSVISESGGGWSVTLTGGGSLTLIDTSVNDNDEGGIYANGSGAYVSLTLEGATITNNQGGAHPGGVQLDGPGALTSTRSTWSGNESDGYGGAVGSNRGDLSFYGDTFSLNNGYYGGAIAISRGTLLIRGGDILSNSYSAISAGASDVQMEAVLVEGNTGEIGAGLYIHGGSSLTDIGSTWRANSGVYGAAIRAYDESSITLQGSIFDANSGRYGGALELMSASANITGSTFTGNSATDAGGAIYADPSSGGGSIEVESSTFEGNSSRAGGAIWVDENAPITLTGCTFDGNAATADGGAVYARINDPVSVLGCRFDHNEAGGRESDVGGAIYFDLGGAASGATLTVLRSTFCANAAGSGGAVYLTTDARATLMANNIFQENEAIYGGGLYIFRATDMDFSNNTLVGNAASTAGGGMYVKESTGAFTNSIVAYQSSGDGAFALDGTSGTGAIWSYSDFYTNLLADIGGTFVFSTAADGNTTTDPGLIRYTADGDCTNDLLGLASTSPLIDAGDPTILDLDGTVSDIGATGGPDAAGTDGDFDGYVSDVDCDDANAAVNPGAAEVCNGVDDDCDGIADGETLEVGTTWYTDADGDGFGDSTSGALACTAPEGATLDGTDCDDNDATIYPGSPEAPYDGVDQDCSGADLTDVDGDDHDSVLVGGDDCDDRDAAIYPGASETAYDGIDQDCSGGDLADVDGDSHESALVGGDDCDDNDATIYPGAPELSYDSIDQDCSGGDLTDVDGDGHDSVLVGGDDCDDNDATIYPGAAEVPYDSIDQDCDDADVTDVDGDGHDASVVGGNDCDDTDATIYTGAHEVPYDGIDQDCDDADVTDLDGDGYDGVLAGGDDCDDSDPGTHPGAADLPDDGIDQDCDGLDMLGDSGTDATEPGCGCQVGATSVGSPLLLVVLLALARRRV